MSQTPWDAYWQSHHTANSFGCDYTENEGPYGTVNQYWANVYASMDTSDVVVDLGAGNGALAKLALDSLGAMPCQSWVSTDLAKVNPGFSHADVAFMQVDAEAMPFENRSIDFFVSMFGIEYADLSKVFVEIERCLTMHGRFDFVIHHSESVISQQSHLTLKVTSRLLKSQSWQNLQLNEALPFPQLKSTLLSLLNELMAQAKNQNEREEVQLIGHSIYSLCQSVQTSPAVVQGLVLIQSQLEAQTVRLQQQLVASKQSDKLLQLLENSPLSCYKVTTLTYANEILGWSVVGKK